MNGTKALFLVPEAAFVAVFVFFSAVSFAIAVDFVAVFSFQLCLYNNLYYH